MLSVPKILSQHPLLTPLFDEGLDWYVWKESAEKKYPKLPDVFQRGCNAKFSVQQGMDMWQVFLRACAQWRSGVADAKSDPAKSGPQNAKSDPRNAKSGPPNAKSGPHKMSISLLPMYI